MWAKTLFSRSHMKQENLTEFKVLTTSTVFLYHYKTNTNGYFLM